MTDDEMDIDVCQCCGRYFAWTELQAELSRAIQPEGVLLQRCVRCLPLRHSQVGLEAAAQCDGNPKGEDNAVG